MRPVLIRLLLDHPWTPWAADVQGVPGIGIALLVAILGLGVFAWVIARRGWNWTLDDRANFVVWLVLLIALTFLGPRLPGWLAGFSAPTPEVPGGPPVRPAPVTSLPIFGYGFMVLVGFLTATWFGQRRARQEGLDSNIVFDATFWTLIGGVLGGRLFYIIQHGDIVFRNAQGLAGHLFAAVNLSNGGLVLIGAMFGGAAAFFAACRRRHVAALPLLDVLTPAIFIGEGFGRIGCLLYGCCFGDPSHLPWAVTFGPGSAAFQALVERGFVLPDAAACMPLHPTQIYSSLNAFLLALVTYAYFPWRRHVGGVFALGLILYPITRFLIEFVRGDELGQLGTGLTISQLLSIGLLTVGLALAEWLRRCGQPVAPPLRTAGGSHPDQSPLPGSLKAAHRN